MRHGLEECIAERQARTGIEQDQRMADQRRIFMLKIGIILGSTRPGRNGEAVARWVYQLAACPDAVGMVSR